MSNSILSADLTRLLETHLAADYNANYNDYSLSWVWQCLAVSVGVMGLTAPCVSHGLTALRFKDLKIFF